MKLKEFLGGDYTPLEHVLYGLVIQLIVTLSLWYFSSLLAIGAGVGGVIGIYFGREHANQQDYWSGPDKLSPLEAAKFWKWDYPSKMDLFCPVISTLIIAVIFLILRAYL